MNAKAKTPLGGFPHAKPKTIPELDANVKVARARLEGCIAERSTIWRQVLEIAAEAKLQPVLNLREQAEQQSQWAFSLERKIIEWEKMKERILRGGLL